jgi:hypothetical protein
MTTENSLTESQPAILHRPKRFHFEWVLPVIVRPRQIFQKIADQNTGVWLTPILILTLTTLILVLASGSIKHKMALQGEVSLPPGYEYYTPEQQAQFQQAMAATSGPVFLYALPAITGVVKVWIGWLLVGGLIHLLLTLLGGRGDTGAAMNLVAWASLPFALRDLVRTIAILVTQQTISTPGLAGFAPPADTNWGLFSTAFLGFVDLYLIWHAVLLVIGARTTQGLTSLKAGTAVLLSLLLVLSLLALFGFLTGKLSGLTIIRPFF